jgi:hypothetical protein
VTREAGIFRTTAPTRIERQIVGTWDQWIVWRLGGRPAVVAASVPLILMASFYLPAWLLGNYETMERGAWSGSVFGLDPFSWAAFVVSLLGGYTLSVTSFSILRDWEDMVRLLPVLDEKAHDLLATWRSPGRPQLQYGRMAGYAGMVLGIFVMLVTVPGLVDVLHLRFFLPMGPAPIEGAVAFVSIWFLVMGPVLFYILGQGLFFSISEGVFLRRLQRHYLRIDLLDIDRLAPLTRIAMRRSVVWIVGATLGSLFFLSAGIERTALEPLFLGICVIAVGVLMPPLIRVHQHIVRTKKEELDTLRAAIREERDLALDRDERGMQAIARLPGLIAFENRIDQVREWPVDFGTASRFALYLGIPVFSWVGGALVEKLVDAFL